jgi:hypothetical protein
MEFFEAIEQFGAVRLLKSSFFAYPVVNALHIAAIGALLTSVLLMDFAVLGAIRSIPREKLVALLRRVALFAFAIAVLTGVTMFSIQATDYVRNPVFLLKLGLIVLAALNFAAFTALDRRRPSRGGGASPALRILAVAAILLWSGVLLAGRFIGFV